MSDKLVTIATFGSPTEAALARNRLVDEGILVMLADEQAAGWQLGTALGGVKLQVAEDSAERALKILDTPVESDNAPADAVQTGWTCPRCGTEVNPALVACPSCGMPADDAVALVPEPPALAGDRDDDDDYPVQSTGDALAGRAFLAAILGLLVCPPLLHFYSLYLLLRLAFWQGELNPASTRKLYMAFAIDLVVILAAISLVMSR